MATGNKKLTCKDCAHSKASWFARVTNFSSAFRCVIPASRVEGEFDYVTGKTEPSYFRSCDAMRRFCECGPDAKQWKPRNSKLVFLYLQER